MDHNTTIQHLGGLRALTVMVAANNYVAGDNSLTFQFKGSRKANRARVTLNSRDLYDVEFYAGRGINVRKVHETKDVYAEELRRTFEESTGLALQIPRIRGVNA